MFLSMAAAAPQVPSPRAEAPVASEATSINLFSVAQDREIGRESAAAADRRLPVVREASANSYVQKVGLRLLAARPRDSLTYRIRLVNSPEVNTVSFSGGWIYLYRGLAEQTASESELAAALAHEIAHVSHRHPTVQLSRQLLVQAPLHIADGLLNKGGWKEQLSRLGVAFGTDASYLRYGPDLELQADLMAVRLLARAGFDPQAVATLVDRFNETGDERAAEPRDAKEGPKDPKDKESLATVREAARLRAYLFSHPRPANAVEIDDAIAEASVSGKRIPSDASEFRAFRSALARLRYPEPVVEPTQGDLEESPLTIYAHPENYYRVGRPDAWQVRVNGKNGAIIAPASGVQASRTGENVSLGVMIDLFDLADRPLPLEQATDRLLVYLRQRNQAMKVVPGAQRPLLMDGESGLRTVLIGQNENGGREILWLVTRLYYSTLFYIVCVAPEEEFAALQPTFERIIGSVEMR